MYSFDSIDNLIKYHRFISQDDTLVTADMVSTRIVKLAARLPLGEFIGWRLMAPPNGLIDYISFGTETVKTTDLQWIGEEVARIQVLKAGTPVIPRQVLKDNWKLYDVYYPIEEYKQALHSGRSTRGEPSETAIPWPADWPMRYSAEFDELIRSLRIEGAMIIYLVGRAHVNDQRRSRAKVMESWAHPSVNVNSYIGHPVRARCLLAVPQKPSVRLVTSINESTAGGELRELGHIASIARSEIVSHPLEGAATLPEYAARILAMEPFVGENPIQGVETCKPETKVIPVQHERSKDEQAIFLGQGMGTSGDVKTIDLGQTDVRRHWQIIGQTGTGKSTLLATAIGDAIKKGLGVTFFDPHGTTIDTILKMVSPKDAERIRVIRIGDIDNPVPINIWNSNLPEDAERIISDLNSLFAEIFDPRREGVIGPRWERWFTTFSKAAISLLGKRASFESIVALSQSRDTINAIADALVYRDPQLAEVLRTEYAEDRSSDFSQFINWAVSKMQRLTSLKELRVTLGAGANALDFETNIDSDLVFLIDLATPKIGAHASRVVGTLVLLQLWNAITERERRDKTYIVALDEAHLFQNDPLPRMLAEGRKFGVGLILAHQHNAQLSFDVRSSLDANAASFTAFRLSVKDAKETIYKFDDLDLYTNLCRLSAFNALTTLSVDGKQSPAFTLKVNKPCFVANHLVIAEQIKANSTKTLVDPYRDKKALTKQEVVELVQYLKNHPVPPLFKRQQMVGGALRHVYIDFKPYFQVLQCIYNNLPMRKHKHRFSDDIETFAVKIKNADLANEMKKIGYHIPENAYSSMLLVIKNAVLITVRSQQARQLPVAEISDSMIASAAATVLSELELYRPWITNVKDPADQKAPKERVENDFLSEWLAKRKAAKQEAQVDCDKNID